MLLKGLFRKAYVSIKSIAFKSIIAIGIKLTKHAYHMFREVLLFLKVALNYFMACPTNAFICNQLCE